MNPPIRIMVVDDHQVVRAGIISLLEEHEPMTVVGEAGQGKEALHRIGQMQPPPEVVLMDIHMPVMDGVECTRQLRSAYGDTLRVVALTMVNQAMYIRKMLQAGASGYILKDCDKYELYAAIEAVHRGETFFSRAVSQTVMAEISRISVRTNDTVALTPRELEVLNLIVQDRDNQEIADALHISIRTVETHKQNLIGKTGTNHVAGLVVYAIRHNLVDI
ncbi:MAG: response regulator transcription factor [Bacteroidia bacterium]